MITSTKLFNDGQNQVVRLPVNFKLPGEEVWVHQDEVTGVIKLTPKIPHKDLDMLFQLIEEAEVPEEFMVERNSSKGSPVFKFTEAT